MFWRVEGGQRVPVVPLVVPNAISKSWRNLRIHEVYMKISSYFGSSLLNFIKIGSENNNIAF